MTSNKYSDFLAQLSKLHYSLFTSPPSTDTELEQVTRLFDLRNGESLSLRGVEGDDYLFLLKGRLDIKEPDGNMLQLSAGDNEYNRYLLPEIEEAVQLQARGHVLLYHVDAARLDQLMLWDELLRDLDPEATEQRQRMSLVSRSRVFRRLPVEHVEEAVACMKQISVNKGDQVAIQGEPGNSFYVIVEGKALVEQFDEINDKTVTLDRLGPRDAFGEDSLITGENRRVTVTMETDATLLEMRREDFDRLVSQPLVKRVSAEDAKLLLGKGYTLLDVRIPDEIELYGQIPGSVLSPVDELHNKIEELQNMNCPFVVYCRSGKRSSLGAMRLAQHNIEAVSLNGGIKAWPYEKEGGFL